jgi:subtilisin family serine protease
MVAAPALVVERLNAQRAGSDGPPPWAVAFRPANAPVQVPAFDRLLHCLRQSGRRRVIVRVAAPPAVNGVFSPEATLNPRAVGRQRAAIVSQQQAALTRVRADSAARATLFELVPYIALDVDEDEFLGLLNAPEVDRIEEDVLLAPVLGQSVSLIGGDGSGTFAGHSGAGVTVAVIDTGVQSAHAFFGGRVVSEACYSTTGSTSQSVCPGGVASTTSPGSGANCSTSVTGCDHGTHVAGIAAGQGSGISGVAKDASIIAIQVFSQFTSASSCGALVAPCALAYTSNLMSGLQRVLALKDTYAIAAANVSIGGGVHAAQCDAANSALKSVIDSLRAAGIVTIIASGNGGASTGLSAPACISTAVSVGSTTKADAVASYSNSASFLHLLAPGSAIYASLPGGLYGTKSGTSMAAPHVAGAWAVARSKKPTATVDEILMAFKSTGVSILDSRNGLRVPRIDVTAALSQLSSQVSTLLWRHTDGRVVTWAMSGTRLTGTTFLNGGTAVGSQWTLVTTGDFDGDGKGDLLWRHSDGRAAVWYMDGTTRLGTAFIDNGTPVSLSWRLAGAADYDGDTKPDLLWRHTDGRTAIWFMNGIVKNTTTVLENGAITASVWSIVGTPDLNGDDKADILWRHSDGRLAVWYMNGAVRLGTAFLNDGVAIAAAWTLGATTDVNGDGHSDLLWRHSDGRLAVWFMNGITRTSTTFLNNGTAVASPWTLAAASAN